MQTKSRHKEKVGACLGSGRAQGRRVAFVPRPLPAQPRVSPRFPASPSPRSAVAKVSLRASRDRPRCPLAARRVVPTVFTAPHPFGRRCETSAASHLPLGKKVPLLRGVRLSGPVPTTGPRRGRAGAGGPRAAREGVLSQSSSLCFRKIIYFT